MNIVRRSTLTVLVTLGGFVAGLSLASAPALALTVHKYETQIVGPSVAEPFAAPWTLALDASGNLYVADPGIPVVDKFDSTNAFLAQLGNKGEPPVLSGSYTRGVAVDDETGVVYVADSNHSEIFVMKPNGEQLSPPWTGAKTAAGTFGGGCCYVYVAVDNSTSVSKSDVYVLTTNNEVDVLEPQNGDIEEGKYLRKLEAPGGFAFGPNDGLAVNDSSGGEGGEVYVADTGHKVVDRFSAEGVYEEEHQIKGPSPGEPFVEPVAVAVDDATGEVYVVDQGAKAVDEFNAAGELLGQIKEAGGEPFAAPLGVAVQSTGATKGDVYVTDSAKKVVDAFGPDEEGIEVAPSEVTTEAATEITETTAKVAGKLNPGGEAHFYFEYGTVECNALAETCGEKTAEGGPLIGTTLTAAGPVELSGLKPGTTYHYWLVAKNGVGTVHGQELTFETTPELQAPSEVLTEEATGVAATTAQLKGLLNPGGEARYFFEYGTQPCSVECPEHTGEAGPLSGTAQQSAEAEVAGLKPNTTYHFRIVATNSAGTVPSSNEQSFKTGLLAPSEVTTQEASEVTVTSAKLGGALNPGGEARYYVEYGTVECNALAETCGEKSAESEPLTGSEQQAATPIAVAGLKPGTTYHYWLVAKNSSGTVHGQELTFQTLPEQKAPSEVETGAAETITGTTATLTGKLNPGNAATTYYFEYGTAKCAATCGTRTEPAQGPLSGGTQQKASSVEVKGLQPATTYYYWLVATNAKGTVHGEQKAFTTEVVRPTEVVTEAPIEVTATTAKIGGSANPGGGSKYFIEYGTEACTFGGEPLVWWFCASESLEEGPVAGNAQRALAPIELTGLTPGTTYKYWVFVYNANGSEHGEEATFTTLPSPIKKAPEEVKIVPPPIATGPTPPPPPPPVVKPPTRAEKLAKALKACKQKPKRKQAACIKQARKRYGQVKKKKKKKR